MSKTQNRSLDFTLLFILTLYINEYFTFNFILSINSKVFLFAVTVDTIKEG